MKIEQINDGETIETIDVITHRQDIFTPDNVVKFDEFKEWFLLIPIILEYSYYYIIKTMLHSKS